MKTIGRVNSFGARLGTQTAEPGLTYTLNPCVITEGSAWYNPMTGEAVVVEDPKEDFTPMGQWRITAYYETGMATASGVYPEIGTTLAHNSLEFGAEVYIEGLGFWTVQDRGPASMGTEWCDIFLGDYGECVQFGETFREVWIVPEGGSQDD